MKKIIHQIDIEKIANLNKEYIKEFLSSSITGNSIKKVLEKCSHECCKKPDVRFSFESYFHNKCDMYCRNCGEMILFIPGHISPFGTMSIHDKIIGQILWEYHLRNKKERIK